MTSSSSSPVDHNEGTTTTPSSSSLSQIAQRNGGSYLQQFCILAKTARNNACVALICQVLKHESIFVFGELLVMPNIQALNDTSHAPYLALLKVFAYGTFADLTTQQETLPISALTPPMRLKLKKLSLVSMAHDQAILSYDTLCLALELASSRELEELVISCVYGTLFQAKCDPKRAQVIIRNAMGRDVRTSDIVAMVSKINSWCANADHLVAELMRQKQVVTVGAAMETQRQHQLSVRLEEAKAKLRVSDYESIPEGNVSASLDRSVAEFELLQPPTGTGTTGTGSSSPPRTRRGGKRRHGEPSKKKQGGA